MSARPEGDRSDPTFDELVDWSLKQEIDVKRLRMEAWGLGADAFDGDADRAAFREERDAR